MRGKSQVDNQCVKRNSQPQSFANGYHVQIAPPLPLYRILVPDASARGAHLPHSSSQFSNCCLGL
jgi:hypothetical protein